MASLNLTPEEPKHLWTFQLPDPLVSRSVWEQFRAELKLTWKPLFSIIIICDLIWTQWLIDSLYAWLYSGWGQKNGKRKTQRKKCVGGFKRKRSETLRKDPNFGRELKKCKGSARVENRESDGHCLTANTDLKHEQSSKSDLKLGKIPNPDSPRIICSQ